MLDPQIIAERLERIAAAGAMRNLACLPATGGIINDGGKRIINLSSNDYLDLANNPQVKEAAVEAVNKYGTGSTASRLMSGNLDLHAELEDALAGLCGTEDALVFGSGFLGNVGVLNALVGKGDAIFSDKLNHASLIDGMLLSGGSFYRYPHSDMKRLEKLLQEKCPQNGLSVIVSDTVFSMDGDTAPVADLVELAEKYKAVLVLDEAHAIGIFGSGGGVLRGLGLSAKADIVTGTLSKSLGSYGGFAACSKIMKKYLLNRARTFIYSTGLPPASVAAALAAIRVIESENPAAVLMDKVGFLLKAFGDNGLDVPASGSQIVPIMVGDNEAAVGAAQRLRDRGIFATAIRPPTVPEGTARLRMSVTCAHTEDDLKRVAEETSAVLGDI